MAKAVPAYTHFRSQRDGTSARYWVHVLWEVVVPLR